MFRYLHVVTIFIFFVFPFVGHVGGSAVLGLRFFDALFVLMNRKLNDLHIYRSSS